MASSKSAPKQFPSFNASDSNLRPRPQVGDFEVARDPNSFRNAEGIDHQDGAIDVATTGSLLTSRPPIRFLSREPQPAIEPDLSVCKLFFGRRRNRVVFGSAQFGNEVHTGDLAVFHAIDDVHIC